MPRRSLAALAVCAVVLATVLGAMGPAAAAGGEDAVRLPTDIAINADAKVQTYEQTEVVSAETIAPKLEIEIASGRSDVEAGYSLNPLKGDTRNDFIRITHKEPMSRTVQVPIREDYWKPFPRGELKSLDGNHTAKLETLKDGDMTYTLITVHFDGEGSAVFPIPADAVAVYSAAERTENRTNSTFGISLGLTPTPWSRVPDSVFTNQTSVRIEGNTDKMMIQYNDGTAEAPEWLRVPDEQTRTAPVYQMKREGVEGAVYVVSQTTDAPPIRYKQRATLADDINLYAREARSLPRRLVEGVGLDVPEVDIPFMSMAVSSPEVVQ